MALDSIWNVGSWLNRRAQAWVHPANASDDALTARHASLIASHALGGCIAAVVFALHFILTGAFGVATCLAILCFLAPLGIALFLSRTGRLEVAHLMSAANLTTIVTLAAALSGGTQSFALAWLALVPLEAALSADRRMMFLATGLAGLAAIGLHIATINNVLPPNLGFIIDVQSLTLMTNLGALAYAGGLAASVQHVHRTLHREIEAGRERYRLIAENANDLITRHDADGRITFASAASRALLGIDPERLMADGFASRLAEADRQRLADALARAVASGAPVTEEFRISRPLGTDGGLEQVWIEWRGQPVDVDAGPRKQRTVVAVSRDITTRKAEAEALAAARDDAERISRAKSAFLATISHELKTPLNAIIGFAEIMKRDLADSSRDNSHAEYSRVIHQSGQQLLGIVRDLLDVSKLETGTFVVSPEPIDLVDVVRAAMTGQSEQIVAKGLNVTTQIPQDMPELDADPRATRQLLGNLLSNACKFTPDGGAITIRAKVVGPLAEIAITDTGCGIAAEHLSRIAQPFYQIDTSYDRQNGGTGLGLTIVRGLVELQGGALHIASEPDQGSTFTITLPLHATDSDGATIISLPVSSPSTRTEPPQERPALARAV